MNHWIFQANPDTFDIDAYVRQTSTFVWTVRQEHFANRMMPGDEVFIWRAAGRQNATSGIVALGELTSRSGQMKEDAASEGLWRGEEPRGMALRVQGVFHRKCLGSKEVVRSDWLKEDPVVKGMLILKMANQTNYLITPDEAQRLAVLVRNTGRDWSREESIAGLWAYAHTLGSSISKLPGSSVADAAIAIGRAVESVYNKVLDFRALDPDETRKGLSASSQTDTEVWNEFFDVATGALKIEPLDKEYAKLWGMKTLSISSDKTYVDFGNAPNDDPNELQQFAAKVRRGQSAFRNNLMAAYGYRCTISGHGPSEVLEAVHIVSHATTGINELDNGLLMRADLHSLFDAGLIRINPDSLVLVVNSSLKDTPYNDLNGKKLRCREDGKYLESKYLRQRWEADISRGTSSEAGES